MIRRMTVHLFVSGARILVLEQVTHCIQCYTYLYNPMTLTM